jgi:membrane-bound lytic murein transglycosylase D
MIDTSLWLLSLSLSFTPVFETDTAMSLKLQVDSMVAEGPAFREDAYAASLDSLLKIYVFQDLGDSGPAFHEIGAGDSVIPTFPDSVYAARLRELDKLTPFELTYHPEVRRYIDVYTTKRRGQVSRMLGLAAYYFPMFEEALDAYDLPLELKYLAIVESALNPLARSRVGATGLWQFMYWTGKMQGLEINSYVDERSDPLKSTKAACEYLSKLYDMFGDWNLALAAYNAGPGNVNKAIRRSGGKKTYWEIRPFLPKETGGYVPAFIAVNYVMNHAADHRIYPAKPRFNYYEVDTIGIREKLQLAQLGQLLDMPEEVIAALNPSLRAGIIPGTPQRPVHIYLPFDKIGFFLTNEDTIYAMANAEMERVGTPVGVQEPVSAPTGQLTHTVRNGESLGLIAKKYGVGVEQLKNWNNLRGNTIYAGQRLKIHGSGAGISPPPNKVPVDVLVVKSDEYLVQPGDTFYSISKRFPGVTPEILMEYNDLPNAAALKSGMKIKIPAS